MSKCRHVTREPPLLRQTSISNSLEQALRFLAPDVSVDRWWHLLKTGSESFCLTVGQELALGHAISPEDSPTLPNSGHHRDLLCTQSAIRCQVADVSLLLKSGGPETGIG